MHLIIIISFKLGHVSIPKQRTFSPLFLFCTYHSSVLKNFKIFIPLLPHFLHDALFMTDITHVLESMRLYCQCITECNYFNNCARKVPKTFPDFVLAPYYKCETRTSYISMRF